MQDELACCSRIHFGRSYQYGGSYWELAMWPHLMIYCIPGHWWMKDFHDHAPSLNRSSDLVIETSASLKWICVEVIASITCSSISFIGTNKGEISTTCWFCSHVSHEVRKDQYKWWWLNSRRSYFLNKGLLIKFVELLIDCCKSVSQTREIVK